MKLFLFLLALIVPLVAQDFDPFSLPSAKDAPKKTESKVSLLSDTSTIAAGEPFQLALKLIHPQGWHSYYVNPGIIGEVLSTDWTTPDGFTINYQGWPSPHLSSAFGYQSIGYEGTVTHLYTVTPPQELEIGGETTIHLSASWQICDEKGCIVENFSGKISLLNGEAAAANAQTKDDFAKALTHYPQPLGEDIKVTAAEADNVITLSIQPAGQLKADRLYLYDEDAQVDVQKPHRAQKDGDTITLTAPRNLGNDLAEAGPVKEQLKGVLSDGTTSYLIDIPLGGVVASEATVAQAKEETSHVDTAQEIAAMAKLYDPTQKINYITLGDTVTTTIWTALFGAFIGGILLNLMPCVFPVLGLKVMGFVEQAGNEPKKIRLHGLAFTAGLVAAMWVLAGIILFLKLSLGREVNWGQQMGNPYFVGSIIILLFVLGLNMAGVFEIGTSLTSAGQKVKKKGYSGSFFSGILTTLIATPCSGPFLGAAMSYTLAQSAGVALFLFTIFALGIALPYLLLSFFPALINKLPRPGAWMETFKVTMSFALFATVAFFMKTFGNQTGVAGLSLLIMGLVILGLALYFFGHWSLPHLKKKVRLWQGKVLPIAIGSTGLYLAFIAVNNEPPKAALTHGWESWHPGKVEQSRSTKRIVWVDYTADW